jgi:hypothetical protein
MKKTIWIIAIIVLLVIGAGQYVKWSNRDMTELTKARRAVLSELRPVLLRFKADTGSFPSSLELLVPQYLTQIPAELQNAPDIEPVKRIRYEALDDTVRFSYHVIRGPDSTEVFDAVKNSFILDK